MDRTEQACRMTAAEKTDSYFRKKDNGIKQQKRQRRECIHER
jgi:hypothetical protein